MPMETKKKNASGWRIVSIFGLEFLPLHLTIYLNIFYKIKLKLKCMQLYGAVIKFLYLLC
jgi:hypothetical protein